MDIIRRIIKEEISRILEGKISVYHGTDNDFDTFSHSTIKSNTGSSWNGSGFYFSDSKLEASLYGSKLMSVEINIENIFDISNIKDSSIQGSGIVELFANTIGLKDQMYNGKSFSELNSIIKNIELEIYALDISFSEGTKDWFKAVHINYDGKDYQLNNKTESEISDRKGILSHFISIIINDKYDIGSLPVRPTEAIDPVLFSKILKDNGYDGIAANNSTVTTGKEYVVFSEKNIKIL